MIDLYEEEVALREVIASGLRLSWPRARDGMIDLQTDYDEPLSMVTADTRRLKQILINLLSNAVKLPPAGGSVTVEAWGRPALGAGIRVIDTGLRTTNDDQARMLEPVPKPPQDIRVGHSGFTTVNYGGR